jgi:alcohol dehydrogenase (cytochrome c)
MHDWDSAQTPVLVDAPFKGRMRKMVMTAARNGYFFVIDRTTGEHLLTTKYGSATNWVKHLDEKGRPMRNEEKDASVGGSLVSPTAGGTVNWEPPAFNPLTGLFYVPERNGYSIFYLVDLDPRGSMGLGGIESATIGSAGSYLTALDYRTGAAAWRYKYASNNGGGGGVLTTAGKLVFAGDGAASVIAHDALTGKALWHSRVGGVTNPPQTYMLDGRQYLIVGTGDTLWAFYLY